MIDLRAATLILMLALTAMLFIALHFLGAPVSPGQRLSSEEWRLLAVSPVAESRFIVLVRYIGGDVRAYDLNLASSDQRDQFLKAQQALKKGKALQGRAKRGRAGLEHDDEMQFDFAEVPETQPKERPSS